MIDNNVVAFYCSNCHKTVWNYEHNFEQLHEKGLCTECLKEQNKPEDKWQKLKEWLNGIKPLIGQETFIHKQVLLNKMQELEGEDDE